MVMAASLVITMVFSFFILVATLINYSSMSVEKKDINLEKVNETNPPQNLSQNSPSKYESSELFQGNSELIIVHQQEEYHLRITRLGKLILTK